MGVPGSTGTGQRQVSTSTSIFPLRGATASALAAKVHTQRSMLPLVLSTEHRNPSDGGVHAVFNWQ
jgi:hypothetical protein